MPIQIWSPKYWEIVRTSLKQMIKMVEGFRFGIYRQNVGIPMGINCAPLVADLFSFCNERDFMYV